MKMNGNTKNQKNDTTHGSLKLTPFERLGMRRPNPIAADNWWLHLHPMEKSIFHWFVRASQIATDTEALEAIATFRDLDNTMLRHLRQDLARALRRHKRLAKARAEKPPMLVLAA